MNRTEVITRENGNKALRKTNDAAPLGFFQAEARGLAALAAGGVPVPQVYESDDDSIVMEWIERGESSRGGWEKAGHSLAELHHRKAGSFGFECDTFCGDTRQPNPVDDDGFRFYQEYRYQPLIERGYDQKLLTRAEIKKLERLVARLRDWIPDQQPALLHGDLWSGNLMFNRHGRPVLIDPACYWGWPEADLAMTHAFGGFHSEFYSAYQDLRPLDPGFGERIELYNLYHWLNHLNMFGSGYHSQVVSVVQRYC